MTNVLFGSGSRVVRRSPTLAQQAALEVADGIRSGALAGDDGLLPSEAVLSQRLGVSRATLREALSQLELGGMIVRRHGIGTFVSAGHSPMESGLEELESIETLARRIGVAIRMEACEIRERAAAPAEAESLQLEEGTLVLDVRRVIVSDDGPIAYLVDVVRRDVLDPQDLEDSFYGSVLDLLLRRGDPRLTHSYTQLSAEVAGDDLAGRLGLHSGDPLLVLGARLYAADGRAVDCSQSYFVPGQFRFHVIRRVSPLAARAGREDTLADDDRMPGLVSSSDVVVGTPVGQDRKVVSGA